MTYYLGVKQKKTQVEYNSIRDWMIRYNKLRKKKKAVVAELRAMKLKEAAKTQNSPDTQVSGLSAL